MDKVDITIIGAGVVGLAIAERLSRYNQDIFVVEKEKSFGQGTSSRNSEVIHAGMYYPAGSLKAKMCVEGNRFLYELCAKHHIPHKKLSKLIVATNDDEVKQLERLYALGKANGVFGLEIIDAHHLKKLEPNIMGLCALFSPETGIIDSHKLMEYFQKSAKAKGVGFVYQSCVVGIAKNPQEYVVNMQTGPNEKFQFLSSSVINAAGLECDEVAHMVGIDSKAAHIDLFYCKGEYFRLAAVKAKLISRLIYPVPQQSSGGLGIHLTPDLLGQVRLGPDASYLENREKNYDVDKNKQRLFYESVKVFAPFVEYDDITPDTAGIRPKLQGPHDGFRDFIITEETEKGFPGFINLIGIESPGLTAAVSIARYVEWLLQSHGRLPAST